MIAGLLLGAAGGTVAALLFDAFCSALLRLCCQAPRRRALNPRGAR